MTKIKTKTENKKITTTEALDRYVKFSNQMFRGIEMNFQRIQSIFDTILGTMIVGEVKEKEIKEDDVFVSSTVIFRDNKFYTVKFITDGWEQVEPTDEEAKENIYKFTNGTDILEFKSDTPYNAVKELRDRLEAASNIEIVKG